MKVQFAATISCWALLDLQPAEEFDPEDPFKFDDSCDLNEEPKLPLPMPYFDRRARAPAPAPMIMNDVFSRVKSDPTTQVGGAPTGNDLLQRRGMTQSMPNLHSSRSLYNRGIGHSVLSSATEFASGGKLGKLTMRALVQEFEALLEDL